MMKPNMEAIIIKIKSPKITKYGTKRENFGSSLVINIKKETQLSFYMFFKKCSFKPTY